MTWVITPMVAYALALAGVIRRAFYTGFSRASIAVLAEEMTYRFLGILSLIHTLICVELFQIFHCDSYDIGANDQDFVHADENSQVRFLVVDHSINCNTDLHRAYEGFAAFAIVIYVGLVPMAMLKLKHQP